MTPEEIKQVDQFYKKVEYFRKPDINYYLANNQYRDSNHKNVETGKVEFTELKEQITEFIGFLHQISLRGLQLLPFTRFQELFKHTNDVISRIDKILNTEKNPQKSDDTVKSGIVNYFTKNNQASYYYQNIRITIWEIIAESKALEAYERTSNFQQELENIASKDLMNEIISDANKIKEIKAQTEMVLDNIQTELSKQGVSTHAKIYSKMASDNSKISIRWLIATICLLVINIVTLIIAVASILNYTGNNIYQLIVSVILLASGEAFALVFVVKNYNAEKHNESVNRHRANCLETFDTFTNSADSETKTAILLQATHTIFSHQKSGYMGKETSPAYPSPTIELLRQIQLKADQIKRHNEQSL